MKNANIIKAAISLKKVANSLNDNGGTLSLKNQILFSIYEQNEIGATPSSIMQSVNIYKTNLASICRKLELEEYIYKKKSVVDNRAIIYFLTEKGIKVVAEVLKTPEDRAVCLPSEKLDELNKLCEKIINIIN